MFSDDAPMTEPERLTEKLPELEERARRLGLYLHESAIIEGQGGVLLLTRMLLGDVAFSKRVQEPDADNVDQELEQMATRMATEEFEDVRRRMARNIAEGRDPLDDGEET